MAEWIIFPTFTKAVAVDLELVAEVWEGQDDGTTLLVRQGLEDVLVDYPFTKFMVDYMDHYDLRPKKKKARPAKAERVKSVPYLKLVN